MLAAMTTTTVPEQYLAATSLAPFDSVFIVGASAFTPTCLMTPVCGTHGVEEPANLVVEVPRNNFAACRRILSQLRLRLGRRAHTSA